MADDFGEEGGYGEDGEAGKGFGVDGHAVGHDDFLESGFREIPDGLAREDRVRRRGVDILVRSAFHERLLRGGQRARGVDDVVEDDAGATFDVADDLQNLRLVMGRAVLVHDGEIGVEEIREFLRALRASRIGGDDHGVL